MYNLAISLIFRKHIFSNYTAVIGCFPYKFVQITSISSYWQSLADGSGRPPIGSQQNPQNFLGWYHYFNLGSWDLMVLSQWGSSIKWQFILWKFNIWEGGGQDQKDLFNVRHYLNRTLSCHSRNLLTHVQICTTRLAILSHFWLFDISQTQAWFLVLSLSNTAIKHSPVSSIAQ